MVDLNAGCLTCFQPADLNVHSADSVQDALRKHFWFTEADLQQAIMCQSCWEQVINFNQFYSSVLELYRNQTSCLIDVKPEPEADEFDCLEQVLPECASVKVDFETEQLENLKIEYSVLSDKEHVESMKDRDVSADDDKDIEPLIEPLLKKNSNQYITQRERVKKFLSVDDRIKKHVKYICEQCGHESETFDVFNEHALRCHHKKSPFLVCCGKKYWKRKTLFQHVRLLENRDMFRCRKCEKNFNGRRAYRFHRKLCHASVSEDNIFDCDQCPRSFSIQHHFKEHMENHAGHWICEKCDKIFASVTRLKQHVSRSHPELPLLTCHVCPQTFRLNYFMQLHKQTHDQQQCQLCPRMLQDRKSLRAHARIIHPDAMVCYTCKQVFPTRAALQAHKVQAHRSMRKHEDHQSLSLEADDSDVFGERSHTRTLDVENVELYQNFKIVLTDCLTECKKLNIDKESFLNSLVAKEEHVIEVPKEEVVHNEKEHTQKVSKTVAVVRPKRRRGPTDAYIRKHVKFICDKCGLESLTFHRYMTHALEKHDDQSAFLACCGKKFRTKYALFQHVQRQNNPNIFRCEDCKISFHSQQSYRQHLKNVHGDKRFECDMCSKSFASKYILWRHKRDHSGAKYMECPHCRKLFTTRQSIKGHFKKKHPDSPKFTCEICSINYGMESWLQEHMRKHKELQCLICPQRFPFGKNLRAHVLNQHPGVELPAMCTICRDVLPSKDALEVHKAQNHMGQNKIVDDGKVDDQPELESSIDGDDQTEKIVQQIEEQNTSDYSDDGMENEDLDDSELSVAEQNSRSTEQTVARYQDEESLHDHVSQLNMLTDENDFLAEGHLECSGNDSNVASGELESIIVVKEEQVIEEETEETIRLFENSEGQEEHADSELPTVKQNKESLKRSYLDEYIRKHVKYSCKKCGKESLKFIHFADHALKEHGDKPPTIECCGKIFREKYALYDHVYKTNNPTAQHRCENCNKNFDNPTAYRRHVQREHVKKKKIKCHQCPKRFLNKHRFKIHLMDRMYTDHHLDSESVFKNGTSMRDQGMDLKSKDANGVQEHEHQSNLVSIIVKSETKVGDDNFLEEANSECSYKKSVEIEQREKTRYDGGSDHPSTMEGLDPEELKQLKQLLMEEELVKKHVQYKCEHCDEESQSFGHFKRHVQRAHNAAAVVRCCGKKFEQRCKLLQHVQLLNDPDAFLCKICLKRSSSRQLLKIHTQKHHTFKPGKKCDSCQKSFDDENVYKRHLKDHNPIAGKCDHCDATFTNRVRQYHHIRIMHINAPKINCEVCCTGFLVKQWFLEHMQGHDREDALAGMFKCGLCPEFFTDKTQRKLHVQDHAGWELDTWPQQFATLPQYICTVCSKAFRTEAMFQQHNLKHEKPALQCPDCPEQFKDDKLFLAHVQTSHQKKKFFCQHCQIVFHSLQAFQDHKVLEHGFKRNCRYCTKSFDNLELVEQHIASAHSTSKPHVCAVCSKGYSFSHNLRRHMIIEHQGEDQKQSASGSTNEK